MRHPGWGAAMEAATEERIRGVAQDQPAPTDHGHELMLNPILSHGVHRFGPSRSKGLFWQNEPKIVVVAPMIGVLAVCPPTSCEVQTAPAAPEIPYNSHRPQKGGWIVSSNDFAGAGDAHRCHREGRAVSGRLLKWRPNPRRAPNRVQREARHSMRERSQNNQSFQRQRVCSEPTIVTLPKTVERTGVVCRGRKEL